jgi:hypothetical protein
MWDIMLAGEDHVPRPAVIADDGASPSIALVDRRVVLDGCA